MPIFETLSPERIAELTTRSHTSTVDLSEYKSGIEAAMAKAEGWGEVKLSDEDNVRAIKRRTTIAAHELGLALKWNRKSTAQSLIFTAMPQSSVTKRKRRNRRNRTETAAAPPAVEVQAVAAPKQRTRRTRVPVGVTPEGE